MTLASRLTALAQAIGADIKGLTTRVSAVESWKAPSFARVSTPVAGQGITDTANGGASTPLILTVEAANNTAGMHSTSTNPTRITALVAGVYNLEAWLQVVTFITAGRITGEIRVNGTIIADDALSVSTQSARHLTVSTSLYLNAGDYVEIWALADNSGVPTPVIFAALAVGLQGGAKGDKGDRGDPLSVVHGVSVKRTTTLSVATATWTTVSFDSMVADNADGQYSAAAADRLTAKATGWYTVVATILWPGPNGNGRRLIGLAVNGATSVQRGDLDPNASATDQMQTESFLVYLNAGDYIQIQVYQDSGATLTLTGSWPQVSLAPHQGSPGPAGANTVRQQRVSVPAFSPNAITFAVDGNKDLGWKLNIVGQIAAITAAKYPYVQLNGLAPYWNQAIEHYVYINGGAPTQNVQSVKAGSGGAGFGFVIAELGLFNVVLDITVEVLINAAPAPNIDAAGNVPTTALEFTAIANWIIRAPAGSGNFEGGDTYNSVEYQQQQLGGGIKSLLLNLDGASFKGDVILTPLLS